MMSVMIQRLLGLIAREYVLSCMVADVFLHDARDIRYEVNSALILFIISSHSSGCTYPGRQKSKYKMKYR